ncbi:hypothetical protein SDC9_123946 [bioreactor metagenome]|uniref:Uncharacterized protein n=1 Tax=bioreactor metagenome TaxID=1076179 RepID=A0A645CJ16_9ZZZZ
MLKIIIFLMLYAVLIFTDLVPIYKAKEKKTILICTGFIALAFVLQFLIIFDVHLPRYADLLEGVLKNITGYSGVQ